METLSAVRGSIVIPAHDEEGVIGRTLRTLLEGLDLTGIHVVVVCNGCTDRTADVARHTASRYAGQVTVIETAVASKSAAIRTAEELLPHGPRLFLDADATCTARAAEALLDAVRSKGADIAVPARVLDTTGCSYVVRLYYRVWENLPWVREQLAGRAAYALSADLREALGTFPDVVADDRWATTRRPRSSAVVLEEAVSFRPPPRIHDLLVARSRVYAGNAQPDVPAHDTTAGERLRGLAIMARNPSNWPGLVVFLVVNSVAKRRARRHRDPASLQWRAAR